MGNPPTDVGAFRRFVNDSPRAKAMFDVDMRYLAASQRWCAAHGITRAELIGRDSSDVNAALPEFWRAVHQRCLAGATEGGERQIRVPSDRRSIWTRWEARPWRTESGVIGGVIIRFEDITAETEARLAIAEREQHLQIALYASNAGTWLADPRTGRVTWDRRSQAILGLGPDAESSSLEEAALLVAKADRERVTALAEQIRAAADNQGWGDEFRIVRPDGVLRWVYSRGRTLHDDDGQLVRVAGITLDVTERKVAEEAARQRQHQTLLALEASSAFAWHWNIDDGPWRVERHVAERIGVPPGEIFQPPEFLSRVHPDDRALVRSTVASVLATGGRPGWDIEFRLALPDTREVCFHSRGNADRDPDGRVRSLYGIVMDVTSRRDAALELQQSHAALRERAAELERRTAQLQRLASALLLAEHRTRERLSKLLHDHLQQLLFSALLNVQRAAAEAPGLGILRQVQNTLTDAIEETRSLSVDVLPTELRRGDLVGALTWLAESMRRKYGLTVDIDAAPLSEREPEEVLLLLFESVQELLFNVVKHAGVDRARLTFSEESHELRITVADNGAGFDTAKLNTDLHTGDGLGLAGIRERLSLFGGHLEAQSAADRGSRFTLVLPRGRARSSPQPAPEVGHKGAQSVGAMPAEGPRPLRILLADDQPAVRTALEAVLHEHPELLVVGEAVDAVEAVRQARLLAPDAVVMGVFTPPLSGTSATSQIRAVLPHVRIYGWSITGGAQASDSNQDTGMDRLFVKGAGMAPLIEELLKTHTEVCGG